MTRGKKRREKGRVVIAAAAAGVLAVGAIAWAAAPSNDAFAAAQALAGPHVSVAGTNVDATSEPDETDLYDARPTVWYSWQAPADGKYRVKLTSAAGSAEEFEPYFNVFTGTKVDALSYVDLDYSLTDGSDAIRAVAGTKYKFRVLSNGGYRYDPEKQDYVFVPVTGAFSLAIDEIPAPVNDDFDDAIVLTGDTFATGGVTEAGTLEPGEPQHDVQVGNGWSVWYRWTAAKSGRVLVASDLPMAVYTGSAVNALTRVARTDVYESEVSGLQFDAVAGTSYSIALDGGPDYGENEFSLRSYVRPSNDDRAQATVVSGTNVFINGSAALSTHEAGEPANFFFPDEPEETTPGSIWYSWTAPVTGRVQFRDFNGYLMAFTGASAGPLTRVDQWIYDEVDEDFTETHVLDAVAGTPYLIAVDTYGPNPFALRISYAGANDAFDDAIELAGATVATGGSTVGATREVGEPAHGGLYGGSVWWDWTAPASGDVLVSTAGSDFDTMLAVYTGSSVRALNRIAENDDAGDASTSRLGFHAEAGIVYRIAVSGASRGYYDEFDDVFYGTPEFGVVRLSIRPGSSNLSVTLAADVASPKIDDAIVFTADAPGASEFRWDFGDGKKVVTLSGEATHSFDAAGSFHVTVLAVDGPIEAAAALDVAVAQDLPCSVSSFIATLNFKKANSDSVVLSGSVALPAGVAPAGQSFAIDVGGIQRAFVLDAKGAAVQGTDSVKVTAKPGQSTKFTVRLTKGSFQALLADEGLENADAVGEPVLVDVSIVLGGTPFDTTVQAFWTGKGGKAGVAK